MAYQLQHFPEHNLIVITVTGSVTLAENREIGLYLLNQIDQAQVKTDVLFDLRALEQFPTSLRQLRESSAAIKDPKLGWIVLLTQDKPLLKFVATVLLQVQTHTGRFRAFNTLGETITFLQDLAPTNTARAQWLAELHRLLT